MELVTAIINSILILIFIYFYFVRGYILGKRKFRCLRCGKCCRLIVTLSKDDIKKLERAGYKNFISGRNRLKKINGNCIFLTLEDGINSCKLHQNAKPEVCRTFPIQKGSFGKNLDLRCRGFWNSLF